MTHPSTSAIILAAGVGSRFHSKRPKVIHSLLGRPLAGWIVDACLQASIDTTVLVASNATQHALAEAFEDLTIAIQPEPRGTGDAAEYGLQALDPDVRGTVLIAAGDTPCITPETVRSVVAACADDRISILTCIAADPAGYGRIIRDNKDYVTAIVEHKDADEQTLLIPEINAGLYAFPAHVLREHLPRVGTNNAQGERYLVDVIALARAQGVDAVAVTLPDESEIQGVNDRAQLEQCAETLRHRINLDWQRQGVTIHQPASVVIEPDVRLAADVEVGPNVQLLGNTTVATGVKIEAGSILRDSSVGEGSHIKAYVVSDQAVIGAGTTAGPYANLRPGTRLLEDAKVGNFVETKKMVLGRGSKASHLTYLGDATIGDNVNIGAGTITCNYDGVNKHQTTIEDEVFVGSDSHFVAPITIGKGATIGAGTTVTKDVEAGALAVSRSPQKNVPGYKRPTKKKD